jgi:uncharacterized membrane protein
MTIWLIAVVAWMSSFVLISNLRRTASRKSFAVLSVRRFFRLVGQASLLTLWVFALGVMVVVILSDPPRSTDLSRSDTLALTFAVTAVLTYFQSLWVHSDILLTDAGISLAHLLIPWKEIRDVNRRRNTVEIVTPKLPRYWNGWTGRLTLYSVLWDLSDDNLRLIEERIRAETHT